MHTPALSTKVVTRAVPPYESRRQVIMAAATHSDMPPRSFTLALTSVVVLAPLAIDMYLASLPGIAAEFHAPAWTTMLTLTVYLLVLGVGQLIAGPLTDAYGRRRPLLIGLALFIVGSLAAALAPSMAALIAARTVQGAGGAITWVVANSTVRDRVEGDAATRVYAALMTVGMFAPIVAPTLGGVLDQYFGWRIVFVCLAVLGAATVAVALVYLPESLPVDRRAPAALGAALRTYGRLSVSRAFLTPMGALTAAIAFLFCYLGGCSYVYQNHFGIDQAGFGVVLGVTNLAALLGPLLANVLAGRIGSSRLAVTGAGVLTTGAAVGFVAALLGWPLAVLAVGMGTALLGLGLAEPALVGMCMGATDSNMGSAAAVLGAAQFLLAAVATVAIAPAVTSGPLTWTAPMLVIAAISLVLTVLASRADATRRATRLVDLSEHCRTAD